jgi:hypothetical protein
MPGSIKFETAIKCPTIRKPALCSEKKGRAAAGRAAEPGSTSAYRRGFHGKIGIA